MATQCSGVDTYGEIGTVLGVVIVEKAAADVHAQVMSMLITNRISTYL
jgi:hypothetical protein